MSREIEEKREFKRAFFTVKEDIVATIQTLREPSTSFNVNILSISAGGLSFFGPRREVIDIKEDDRLTVTDLKTPKPLGPIATAEVMVKYIKTFQGNDRIILGCVFTKMSDALRNKVQNFVESRLGLKGPSA